MKTLSAKAISREYLDVTNGKTDERKKLSQRKKSLNKKNMNEQKNVRKWEKPYV